MRRLLSRSPALLPGLGAIVTILVLAASNGGFYPRTWLAGGLFLVGLLTLAILVVPIRDQHRPALAAVVLLALFALWGYVGLAWADQPEAALEGANRAALYAAVLALFALWPLRTAAATVLIAALAIGVAVIGLVELVRIVVATDPAGYFQGGRLNEPVGYQNGAAALWTCGAWAAVGVAARRETGAALAGTLVAGAVLLGGLAVLAQSRGWLFATPLVALAFLALTPARLRAGAMLVVVILTLVVALEPLLDVSDAYVDGDEAGAAAVDDAGRALVLGALLAGAVGAALALAVRRVQLSPAVMRRVSVGALLAALVLAGGGIALFAEREGNPRTRLADAWDEFKRGGRSATGSERFTASLGTNRYDFWRVAWGNFEREPVHGVGPDNFQQDYLARRRSDEVPRYPHSLELQVLSQTGIVGALLLLGALGAALVAAAPAVVRGPPGRRATAAAALTVFLYWFLHGSIDWFWEMTALGLIAFAMLGIAVALGRGRPGTQPGATAPQRRFGRGRALALAATSALALALLFPWIAEMHVARAIDIWGERPGAALDHLDRAASINPFATRPNLAAASISLRLGRLGDAGRHFEEVLDRDPRDLYATLNLGVIRWQMGEERAAMRTLRRARRLAPDDEIVADVLEDMLDDELLDVNDVNRRIVERSRERAG